MKITCVSDLHGNFPDVGSGDLLLICGDLTARDEHWEYIAFRNWCNNQKYKKVIVIAGNHDNYLQNHKWSIEPDIDNIEYLCDSGTEFKGLKIWGSPWTRTFKRMNPRCKAFTFDTEEELYDKFVQIPPDVDILITHSPAYGILDGIPIEDGSEFHLGSTALFNWLKDVGRPRLHVCGHIHRIDGMETRPFRAWRKSRSCVKVFSVLKIHLRRGANVNEPVDAKPPKLTSDVSLVNRAINLGSDKAFSFR